MRAAAPARRAAAAAAALALGLAACDERLTAPADCPALCPGGQPEVFDTVISALPDLDSTFIGYVTRQQSQALLVANDPALGGSHALIRFEPRDTGITFRDTLRPYTVDSVDLTVQLLGRDTLADGLELDFYRVPRTIDSTTTWADVAASFSPATFVGTLPIPDSIRAGTLTLKLRGADVDRVAFTPADSNTLALGVSLRAPTPTGVRLSSIRGSGPPGFLSYVRLPLPPADSGQARQAISTPPAFTTWVDSAPVTGPPGSLVVGGTPSARSLVRFALPPRIRDSATIVRATVEVVPSVPFRVVPGDQAGIELLQVFSDLGAKSPLIQNLTALGVPPDGSSDTLRIDVINFTRLWQGPSSLRPVLFLRARPEGNAFGTFFLNSTRSPGGGARLRITYIDPFRFGRP